MKFPPLLVTLALLTALSPSLHAGHRSSPKSKPQPAPAIHTTITSISADSITVQESKAPKTFAITSDREIDLNGQRVTASALQAGMRMEISMGMIQGVASRINASEAPPAPAKPAGKE